MKPRFAWAALLGIILAPAPTWARDSDAEAQGRRIAAAYCGQCHALGSGPSPLADAPPFATLHRRYPDGGGLEDLLGEGMIAPAVPPEEGQPRMHPRMPQAKLDEDQVADLIAFLKAAQRFDAERP
jgi:mono/diheme cytochrome c family protein